MDPLHEGAPGGAALDYVLTQTLERLSRLPDSGAYREEVPTELIQAQRLPEQGVGSLGGAQALWELCAKYAANSTGPRYFDFIIGGVTPAALAADWITSVFDQNAAGRVTGALASDIEALVLDWLKGLLGLSAPWHGALVPSTTYGTFAGLSCARQWWGEKLGIDVTNDGTHGLPPIRVIGTTYTHPSVEKAAQMLGMGRRYLTRIDLSDRAAGLAAVRNALATDQPTIVVASAGDVNGGRFDPMPEIADLVHEAGSWLHVDAAFGLFAAFEPSVAHLLDGLDRADSIASDGHKWLNVPYDSGIAFVRDRALANRTFAMPGAPFFEDLAGPNPGYASLSPDSSRRARAFPMYAALLAYGREGIAEMIRRQIGAAATLASALESSGGFRMLARSDLPVLTFRAQPRGLPEAEVDDFNSAVAAEVNALGRFAVGTTVVSGVRALRVALLNWAVTDDIAKELFNELDEAVARVLETRA